MAKMQVGHTDLVSTNSNNLMESRHIIQLGLGVVVQW